MKKIILASNSPRRRELLDNIGLKFDVIPDNTPEPMNQDLPPWDMVMMLAKFKGDNVLSTLETEEDAIIIAADTVVSVDNKILGKPKNEEDAHKMLCALSGRSHVVYTGVYVIEKSSKKSANFYEKTKVSFKNLDINEIRDYINSREPMDKAGSYGIQNLGSLFVEEISGDYFNVVGLPVCHLGKVLTDNFGIKFF